MRYVAAYLLTSLGGNTNPKAADIDKVLSSVGIESDAEKVKKVIAELSGKNLEEIIAQGQSKLASMPAAGAAPAGAAPAEAAAGDKQPAKKEEKKEESEEEDDDMGFGLFD